MQGWCRYLCVLAVAILVAPAAATADGADDLALSIEQNLAGIAFRLDLRPDHAEADLEAQGRQLELLAAEAPDHPALPELQQTYRSLQADLTKALATTTTGEGSPVAAPPGFDSGMEEVETLQARAEAEFLGGDPDQASGYLEQAEAQVAALERRYRNEIPAGHVPLLVAKEKLAALKDQLEDSE